MTKGLTIQLASRLRKAAADLYYFVEHPEIEDPAKYLTVLADLIDVSAVEVEAEIIQIKRTLGGTNAKLSETRSELALMKAKLDKITNDGSPAIGMAARYDS